MIFANTQAVEGIPASIPLDCDAVFFSMRGVSHLDVSCAQAFEGVILSLKKRGIRVGCCGLSSETRKTMERSGILALIGEENVYWSIDRALTQECDSDRVSA